MDAMKPCVASCWMAGTAASDYETGARRESVSRVGWRRDGAPEVKGRIRKTVRQFDSARLQIYSCVSALSEDGGRAVRVVL